MGGVGDSGGMDVGVGVGSSRWPSHFPFLFFHSFL